jgi:hypothetical protein
MGTSAGDCGVAISQETPPVLLRFFEEEDHARSFVQGTIRFGLLERYWTIEGSRRDGTEGKVSVFWNLPLQNPVHYDGSSLNPHYILSTSHPEANTRRLMEKFGSYIVRINNPIELLQRIEIAWKRCPLAIGRCVIEEVVYNKDSFLEPTPGLLAPVNYSYSQKAKSFEEEREFRFVLTCTADHIKLNTLVLNDHLSLNLPDCSDICSRT